MSIFGGAWPFGFGMNGQEIYENFQTGEGGKGLQGASDDMQKISKRYQTRFDDISNLTVRMEQAWQGPAGGVARRGAGPLAVEHALAAPSVNDASATMKDQVTAFGETKQVVQKPPPEPTEPSGLENLFTLGGAGETYDKKKAEYDAVNQNNTAAMGVYEDTSTTNTSRMPTSYGSLTADGADIGVQNRTPPPIGPPPIGPYQVPGGGGGGNDGTSGTTGTQGTGGSNQNVPGGNTGGGKDTTLPSRNDPPNKPPYDPTLPPGGRPGPGRGQQDAPYGPMGPYGPNQGGSGPGGGRGGSGFGPRGGPGGFGPGGSGGSGMRGPGGGFGPGGAGAAAAAEGAPARGGIGGAGAAGGRGAGAMGGMGGGRGGQGSDDADHERPSFLVEPDPHETFGTDQVTAPPVIGE